MRVGELPDPAAAPGQVEIVVAASGANFPDVLMVRGQYQFRPEPPFAPGLEVAGTVASGDGFPTGERVMAYVPHGGWAERVVADAANVFPMPPGMPFEVGAVLPVVYGTAIHALVDRGGLTPGETLVVLGGAGGVGLAAVQVGRLLGARVVAVVGSDDKERAATAAGADAVVRHDRDDLRDALRAAAPDGVDVVFDPVGGDATEIAFRSLSWGGRLLVVGFAAGAIPAIPANLPLLKGASLVGRVLGSVRPAGAGGQPGALRHAHRVVGAGESRPDDHRSVRARRRSRGARPACRPPCRRQAGGNALTGWRRSPSRRVDRPIQRIRSLRYDRR